MEYALIHQENQKGIFSIPFKDFLQNKNKREIVEIQKGSKKGCLPLSKHPIISVFYVDSSF